MPEHSPYVIEAKFFGAIDSGAAKVFEKLIVHGVVSLSDADRSAWAYFLNSLLERGQHTLRQRRDTARVIADRAIEKLRAMDPSSERLAHLEKTIARIDTDAAAHNSVLGLMVSEIRDPAVIQYFKSCHWLIMRGAELITTDVPLVINGGGVPSPIRAISFALNPKVLFVMHEPTVPQDAAEAFGRNAMLEHNELVVCGSGQYVYSARDLRDGPLWRLVEERFRLSDATT